MTLARQRRSATLAVVSIVACVTSASSLLASESLPPWSEAADIPLPPWARSVLPTTAEGAIYTEPGKLEVRRGSAQPGVRLPLFATRLAPGCAGRWINVGPLAWMCSDVVELAADAPGSPPLGTRPWVTTTGEDIVRPSRPGTRGLPPLDAAAGAPGAHDDGLPFHYYFAGRDGAYGFADLDNALDDAPDQELEPGFAVAILEERSAHGEQWGRTKKGRWIAMRELIPVRANLFHGQLAPSEHGDAAWIVSDKASVFPSEKADKPSGVRVRFETVRIFEEKPGQTEKDPGVARISPDGEPATWMRLRDLARPRWTPPPPEVVGGDERWIDVDLGQQTLVAYEGKRPVFATIVSTGKGPPGSEFATHPGTFRIWVKVFTTKMDNLDKDDVDRHYAIEDVPWVQFFDKAIALHGAFWHGDFGRTHSHGCVNLSPIDARWLFAFTAPHLPTGWTAVLPTRIEGGTVVRVR